MRRERDATGPSSRDDCNLNAGNPSLWKNTHLETPLSLVDMHRSSPKMPFLCGEGLRAVACREVHPESHCLNAPLDEICGTLTAGDLRD